MKEQHGLGQRLSSCDQPASSSLHRRGFLMAGLAGAGVLAGCGGGGDAGGSIPSPVNTAEDARQTNQVGATATAPTTVRFEAKGRQILRNGEPYFAKGMCYSPQPIGAHFKDEPWGDFFSDFWQPLFSRDLPLLKAMGVNSIRLYSTLPFRLIYDANSTRLSHKLFLDACQDAGISVWVGFPIDGGVFPAQDKAQLERIRIGTQLLAEQVGQHPAVIGFTISNEANIDGRKEDPSFWSWINELAGIAKAKAPDKLTMISLFDDTGMRSINYAETRTPNLDVFGINAYRGTVNTGMSTLFTEYQNASTRPLLITEFGCSASTRSTPKNRAPRSNCRTARPPRANTCAPSGWTSRDPRTAPSTRAATPLHGPTNGGSTGICRKSRTTARRKTATILAATRTRSGTASTRSPSTRSAPGSPARWCSMACTTRTCSRRARRPMC